MLSALPYKSLMAVLWKDPKYGTYYIRHSKGRFALKTKDERKAQRKLKNWLRDQENKKPSSPGTRSVRFFDFVTDFLEYIEVNYPESTHALYSQALTKAKASWGNINTDEITPRHIDTLLTDMKRSGLAAATINKNYRHVKGALSKAVEWGYLIPFKFPKQVKEQKQQRYISEKDLDKLFAAIKDSEFYDFCLFAVYSGLRSGELVRLRWDDVDNPEGFLRITAEQKNKTESRIPINSSMREILERYKGNGRGKVFRFSTVNWVSQKFKGYLEDAGLLQYRFHDLRHSYGSYLAMQGYSPKTIKELMRHKSIHSTMGYLDLSPEHLSEASEGFKLNIKKQNEQD